MIFILSVGPSALIYFSKKFEISADVIFVGAAPSWPNLTQPDQTIMRYLMTSYMKVQHQSPHFQGREGKNSWRLSEVTIGNLMTAIIFFLKIPNFSQLWQHREKVVLHNRLELWLWRLGQVTKVTISLLLWNIGSRLFIIVRFRQLCYFRQKRPFSCFPFLNISQVLKQSLELWGLQRRRVGPK